MPMLRAGELAKYVEKAKISHALCDTRLMDEMVDCAKANDLLKYVVGFDGTSNHDAELDRLALSKPVKFNAVETASDDVALIGFTSGSTGNPKATMHFHRDLLIIADGYAKEVLNVQPEDVFVGSPPLAFTFGLGGLAIFPLRFGATAVLLEKASPPNLIEIIEKHRATVCFTAPTAYRAMLKAMDEGADLSSLRAAVSAGETLPGPVYQEWQDENRQADAGRHWRNRDAAYFHLQPLCRSSTPPAPVSLFRGYEAQIVDSSWQFGPGWRGRTACRSRANRVPISARGEADWIMSKMAGTSQAMHSSWMRRDISTSLPATTT